MGKGLDRKPRVSFFPRSRLRIVQMKITTKEPLCPLEEAPASLVELFDFLQVHHVFPRYVPQRFPNGTHQLSIIVQLDTAYVENVYKKVSRLNLKKKKQGCCERESRPLISKVVPNDEPPIFNAPPFAPLLPSSF